MTDETAGYSALVDSAFARGQAALAAGDGAEALRWLDRARRLAPEEGAFALSLASAAIGFDTPRAIALFVALLETVDSREAWLGLAAARLLTGEAEAARTALAEALSRHAPHPDLAALATQVARATNAPGWCGVGGDGRLIVHAATPAPVEARIDGALVMGNVLPPVWTHARWLSVTSEGRPLIGSPVALDAIARTEGFAKAHPDGLRGWAWHPGAPDIDPRLSVGAGQDWRVIVASRPMEGIRGLPPLARPRAFLVPWSALPAGEEPIHLRGREGRDLLGSPVPRSLGPDHVKPRPSTRSARGKTGRSSSIAHGPEPAVAEVAPDTANLVRPAADAAVSDPQGRRVALARWRAAGTEPSVILVTHDDGGGVARRVDEAASDWRASGHHPIVLRPLPDGAGVAVDLGDPDAARPCFRLPSEAAALARFLRGTRPAAADIHHGLNHNPAIFRVIRGLGVPYTVHTHDFAWFCPRVALLGRGDRYCGEPAPPVCESCVAEMGSYLHEDIRVTALIARSRTLLAGAAQVVAPSDDAAGRMARHFPGLAITVVPHEDDQAVPDPPPIPVVEGTMRVCVAGAIGLHKGFHVLLACARDAHRRGLDLFFAVVGTTLDDQALLDTGHAFVTGRYDPAEAVALIRAQEAALGFLPSVAPETWCLGLTELWRAGLRVAAFDLGAPAERVRRTGRGLLLPPGARPEAINDALLAAARGRSVLSVRRSTAYKPPHDATSSQ